MSELSRENGGPDFGRGLRVLLSSQAMLLVLIVLFAAVSLLSDKFLTTQNLFNIIRQSTVLGMMACGMTVVIIGKGVDLSAASILALCAVVNVMLQPLGYAVSIVCAILVGIACGLINGYLIGKVEANFIIVTLGTQILFTAAALIVSEGRNLKSRTEPVFSYIGDHSILGIPVMGYFLLATFVVFAVLLHRTAMGRRLFATGINARAARVAGINTSNIIMGSYVVNGLVCAIGAIVLTSRLPRIRVGTASEYLFDSITVVVLGGTALTGGVGGIVKTLVGLGIFAIIANGMSLMGIPYEYQQMIKGIILVLAVLLDELTRRKRLQF
jgi:ribose/xylose/arabinose/galactoside ABC-type transport system permease subunit